MIFPTVTVCPLEPYNETTVNTIALTRLANHEKDLYEQNMILLQNITRVSYDNLKEFTEFNIKNFNSLKTSMKYWDRDSLRKWVFRVAIEPDDVFNFCKFRGEEKNCEEIFLPIYSERGFCYSFNPRYYGEAE